jgi:hypothetical protein
MELNDEPLTPQDREAIPASREYFERNPKPGAFFEEFAAECGFTMDQIRDSAGSTLGEGPRRGKCG